MAEAAPKIRLFVDAALGPGAEVMLAPDQAHYLFNVMRAAHGTEVAVFNGRDGEWLGPVTRTGRLGGSGHLPRPRPAAAPAARPLAGLRADQEGAHRLHRREGGRARRRPGAAGLHPPLQRPRRIQPDRLRAHAIEAAEQCGETYVLDIARAGPPRRAARRLGPGPPPGLLRRIARRRPRRRRRSPPPPPGPWAILIGPEGGFAPEEAARLRGLPFVLPVTLGPRVLRADTAAVAALTLWQAALGDWR